MNDEWEESAEPEDNTSEIVDEIDVPGDEEGACYDELTGASPNGNGDGKNGRADDVDPIRTYLMQMGDIPLMSREEELDAAKMIDGSRARFRRRIL
ncbi:MAG: sigma-70 factor domain-containing protein, partial [Candidatus Peribacteraceae bacterium]|nr:sigma-70 factor domain-containing protein [Candidatus Peribacteraceae bacterium]